ncbi:MAG: amidophosphoribosyltransferase [Propionibacteriaceae bacterium]|jgi:amidophosphoribosyltransferase|nr:amidophosphoribosyltransferase [Propionibacteriaceae bacterium]
MSQDQVGEQASGHNQTDDDKPKDECGVFGVWAPDEEVAKLTYFGLYALQHRGQESAGMAVADGERIMVFKDMGLVSQVFNEPTLDSLTGHIAIGHTRYSTTGASRWENAQPTFRATSFGDIALAHNGNLTNTEELIAVLQSPHPVSAPTKDRNDSSSDTAILASLLAAQPGPADEAIARILPRLEGAFSLVFMTKDCLYAARDRHGVRPLCVGKLGEGWVVASESAALDIVGAQFVREVEPGEYITIDQRGLTSRPFQSPARHQCLFEYVYLSRPDTVLNGRLIHNIRVKIGKMLAEEQPVKADLVIPVPDSGTPAAIGFAAGSGIEYGQGLVKNAYVGRTFIQPSQTLRQRGIRLKLNPLKHVVAGKRLVVVDDSIVRGNTQRQVVAMLRQAGAAEVHVRISSPPVLWPCFFGIDFADPAELIAQSMSVDQIAQAIGADSLGYIDLKTLIEATHVVKDDLCRACFDGRYDIPVPPQAARQLGLGSNCTGCVYPCETTDGGPNGLAPTDPELTDLTRH